MNRFVVRLLVISLLAFVVPAFGQAPAAHLRTVHVASLGDGSAAAAVRQRVIERLNKSGEFRVVDDSAAADGTLRGMSNIWSTGSMVIDPRSSSSRQVNYAGYLSVELVDRNNQPLWSYLATPGRFRTDSITEDLANRAVERLVSAARAGALKPGAAEAPSATSPVKVALHAAGATLPQPLYMKWFESAGMAVAYDAVGSEAGIAQLTAGKVDFAASDIPLKDADAAAQLDVAHFPTVVGGVVPIYNLPGVGDKLRLTPLVLAGIYSGSIRRWNDARIRETNGGAHLPDAEIAVVHRDDGSGTTFVWTSFLALASAEWKTRVGAGAHVEWPAGTGATGSDGVAALVAKTPNSIGYVELIYAIQHQLNYAAVENPAHQFIKADLASITAAAQWASEESGKGFRYSILNAPGKSAYPISTLTWLLIPEHGLAQEKKESVAAMLRWMLTTGQKDCSSLGYAPLPREVAARALQAVDGLK